MPEPEDKSIDILGIKPLGEALNTAITRSFDGAAAFLSRICLPAAEEFGLLLRDRVSHWRAKNAAKIANKAEAKLASHSTEKNRHASPRLVAQILEHGSWSDSDTVQDMWGGLLASSCTPDGKEEENLIFIDLLSRLTTSEAKLLNYLCESARKYIPPPGWVIAAQLEPTPEEITDVTGISEITNIDNALDHLVTLGLLTGGFDMVSEEIRVQPTTLALQMYARCQGHSGPPREFFTTAEHVNSLDDIPMTSTINQLQRALRHTVEQQQARKRVADADKEPQ